MFTKNHKQYQDAYHRKDVCKQYRKKYQQTESFKESHKNYMKGYTCTDKYKTSLRSRKQTPKYKEQKRRYEHTDKYKQWKRGYNKNPDRLANISSSPHTLPETNNCPSSVSIETPIPILKKKRTCRLNSTIYKNKVHMIANPRNSMK